MRRSAQVFPLVTHNLDGEHVTLAARPLISVVVPVYRVEDHLAACLDSVLGQAGDDVEIVAVDDDSPDRCGVILDDYAARDPRVRVIHLPRNGGLGPARNTGIDHARGRYLWFVDSDDWVPPGTIPAIRNRLTATAPDVLLLDHVEVRVDGQARATGSGPLLRSVTAPVRLVDRPELLRTTLIASACTKVISRQLLDDTGLRFTTGWYEDCAFALPLLLAAGTVDAIDQVGYCYRHRANGAITRSLSERHFEVFDQYERMWQCFDQSARNLEPLRPELFRLMLDHLLVIAGNTDRLPDGRRREFFQRIVDVHHRRRPGGGYTLPDRGSRLTHRQERHNAYPAYAAMRFAYRAAARLRRPARAPHLPRPEPSSQVPVRTAR
jgi:glycosyltransferase involved in cell wall biosynthesis